MLAFMQDLKKVHDLEFLLKNFTCIFFSWCLFNPSTLLCIEPALTVLPFCFCFRILCCLGIGCYSWSCWGLWPYKDIWATRQDRLAITSSLVFDAIMLNIWEATLRKLILLFLFLTYLIPSYNFFFSYFVCCILASKMGWLLHSFPLHSLLSSSFLLFW